MSDRLQVRLFGHPAHPLLVHFPIAFWSLGAVLDALAIFQLADTWRLATLMISLGLASGLVAMLAGLLDYASLPDAAQRDGQMHMALMAGGWLSFAVSILGRLKDGVLPNTPEPTPVIFSTAGFILLVVGGWYGGQLVYKHGAGRRPDAPP